MTVRILYVEDDPADVELLTDAFDDLRADVHLTSVQSGRQALDLLFRRAGHDQAKPPDLILLDLNLPEMSGREVLAAIKSDAALRTLPVVVLTTSLSEADVKRCFDLGANAFVGKPTGLAQLRRLVGAIHEFWVASNRFVTPGGAPA